MRYKWDDEIEILDSEIREAAKTASQRWFGKKAESVSVQGEGSNLQNLKKKKIINNANKWDDEIEILTRNTRSWAAENNTANYTYTL